MENNFHWRVREEYIEKKRKPKKTEKFLNTDSMSFLMHSPLQIDFISRYYTDLISSSFIEYVL